MDSSEEELGQVLAVGDHCSVEHCRQIDFLPFKCDCCNRTFCLEHRSYSAHACPNAGAKETTVIVCPICAKSIHLKHGQEPNEAFDVHQRTGCDPSNYDRVHKKPRCPVGGCKEKLTTINAYRCKHCSQRVCLRHRDPGDHGCAEAQAALRQQRATGFGGSNSAASSRPSSAATGAAGAAGSAPAGGRTAGAPPPKRLDAQQLHAAAAQQYNDPANSLRGTAARRQQLAQQAAEQQRQQQQQSSFQWPWQQQPQRQQERPPPPPPLSQGPAAAPSRQPGSGAPTNTNRSTGSNANPLVPPHLPEKCPQCGASFATVERLIQHVEDFHPSSPPTRGSAAAAPGPTSRPGAVFTNPLQGLLSSTTIAGGAAPAAPAVPGPGYPYSGATAGGAAGSGGGGGGGAGEVFRCYHCSQTFNDPVLLVQHADRCAAAPGTAVGRGGGRGSGGASSSSGGGGGGSSKDNCVLC